MKNLADHIADLMENSVEAGATRVDVAISLLANGRMTCSISDNGKGMSSAESDQAIDPFFTTRTTRKIGLGLALIDQNSKACNGSVDFQSDPGSGSVLLFTWDLSHIDCLPCGDIPEVFITLLLGHPGVHFQMRMDSMSGNMQWDSVLIRESIAPISLDNSPMRRAVRDYLQHTFDVFYRDWICINQLFLTNLELNNIEK